MLRNDYDEESQFTTDFHFIDEDGEVVWVHTQEMVLISVPEHVIARERTAQEWDALAAEVTPVQAAARPFEHTVVVLPTPFQTGGNTGADKRIEFQSLYQLLVDDDTRNRAIAERPRVL